MLGPLFFIILFFALFVLLKKLLTLATKRVESSNCLVRLVRSKIDYSVLITRFLLEGCLEIGVSAIISVLMIEKQSFMGFWEAVSTITAFISLALLLVAPFILIWKIRQHLKNATTVVAASSIQNSKVKE